MKFEVGSFVFAKVKGYPPWPAKVFKVRPPHRVSVYFFGTGETSIITKERDLYDYKTSLQQFVTKRNLKRVAYQRAMDQIELEYESAAYTGDLEPETPRVMSIKQEVITPVQAIKQEPTSPVATIKREVISPDMSIKQEFMSLAEFIKQEYRSDIETHSSDMEQEDTFDIKQEYCSDIEQEDSFDIKQEITSDDNMEEDSYEELCLESEDMEQEFLLTDVTRDSFVYYERKFCATAKKLYKYCRKVNPQLDKLVDALDSFAELKVTPFMLIKHEAAVYPVHKITRYHPVRIELSERAQLLRSRKVEIIRNKAIIIANLFRSVLEIPRDEHLYRNYIKMHKAYRSMTKRLGVREKAQLTSFTDIYSVLNLS